MNQRRELQRGEHCSECGGSRATLEKSLYLIGSSLQGPFKEFANKFKDNLDELYAMHDLYHALFSYTASKHPFMDGVVERIRNGELPSAVKHDIWYKIKY